MEDAPSVVLVSCDEFTKERMKSRCGAGRLWKKKGRSRWRRRGAFSSRKPARCISLAFHSYRYSPHDFLNFPLTSAADWFAFLACSCIRLDYPLLYFILISPCHLLQSIATVALVHSRSKTPGLVSLHRLVGVP